jgi:histidinol-phosphatase
MTTHSPQDWLNILQDCANEADRIANHYFNSRDIQITQKADNSPVTQADQEIETVIRKHILNSNPDIGVIGEEFDSCDPKTPIKLIIDPIDGTSNFIRNIPIYGTLLAIEVNNDIVAGVVSNGTQKDRWAAAKDCGATYNNTPIHVSSESDLSKSQSVFA